MTQLMQSALLHHRAGHLDQAEQLYRQVLEVRPSDPHALHYLGLIAFHKGLYGEGLGWVSRSIQANPQVAQSHHTLGVLLDCMGRETEAVEAFRQAISLKTDYAEAYNSMAISLQRMGQAEEAIEVCRRVLVIQPAYARAYHTMGYCLHTLARLDEAVSSYQQALIHDPGLVEVYNQLGVVLSQQQRFDEAVTCLLQAIQRVPHYAEAHNNLGIALRALGHLDQATSSYLTAIRLQPQFPEAYYNLANVQAELGLVDQAVELCHKAIALKPDYAQAHNQLGIALARLGRRDEAMESYKRAIQLDGSCGEFYNNLAICQKELTQYRPAIQNYLRAVALEPTFAEAHCNLANALKELGDCDRAIACYDQALALRSDYGDAHWNRALALLLKGDFRNGWQAYQWRHRANLDTVLYPHAFTKSRWQGEPLKGRRLLLYCEQGLGDAIQFIRFLPQIRAKGVGQLILETWPALVRLFSCIAGVDRLTEASTAKLSEDQFDLCVSIMDLPYVFGASLETLPASVPYLQPDPIQVHHWRRRICGDGLKVGLVWAGSPTHGNDAHRSCPLQLFSPLMRIPGIRWYGLQKGPAAAQASALGGQATFTNLGEEFGDLMDAASAVASLDLVVSVDTAMAHLAGSLGRPTWTLLPFAPDWRWMLGRDDSPWYPTMRLFRQSRPKDWASVLALVAAQLRDQTRCAIQQTQPQVCTNQQDLAARHV